MASSFNGSTALAANSAPAAGVPLTLAAWVRPAALGGSQDVLNLVDGPSAVLHAFRVNLTPTAVRAIQTIGGGAHIAATAAAPATGRWQHVAAVFVANNSRIAYLDGSPSTTSVSGGTPSSAPTLTYLGRFPDTSFGNFLTGDVAVPAVWGAALSAAELRALAAGVPPWLIRPDALLEYWPLRPFEARSAAGLRRDLRLNAVAGASAWTPDPAQLAAIRRDPDWPGRLALPGTTGPTAPARPRRWFPGLSPARRDTRRRA